MAENCKPKVNNAVYDLLKERWYEATDDPIALLRAEARLKNPWVLDALSNHFTSTNVDVLDVGCGAGFLSNFLSEKGMNVTAIDVSGESLDIAKAHDASKKVRYECANAYELPYPDKSFSAVCAMDFLEHVEDPQRVLREASRVLKPGGIFFFHTFNRNFISWLIVIKGVEFFVKNTPKNLHVLPLFIKPKELTKMLLEENLVPKVWRGMKPVILKKAFLKMLLTGNVDSTFQFEFINSLKMAYVGYAVKV